MSKQKIIVVGNGMVSYKFCEKIIAKSGKSTFDIVVFGEETRPAYDRVHLSSYFEGKTIEDLTLAPASWYAESDIRLVLGDPIVNLALDTKTVTSHHGLVETYDYLILATGSAAFVPQIEGIDKHGVFVYRTIEDLDLMQRYAKKARIGAVVGGGLLGLEAAKALLDLGIEQTHVIEFAPRLMPRQIDTGGSQVLQAKLEELGLTIHLSKNTEKILGNGKITGLRFADETTLNVDMLVISAGIKPRDELARIAGLAVGVRGGIVVNEKLQTSDPSVFAIGECALASGMIWGLVAPGYEMADIVATNLTGGEKRFKNYDLSTKLKLIGVDVASFGDAFAGNPYVAGVDEKGYRSIVFRDEAKGIYKRVNISADGKYLVGGILVGDASQFGMLQQTVNNKMVIPPNAEDLILGARGGSNTEGGDGVMDLPDEALICSCEAVTKGEICTQVTDNECFTVDSIKKCTKAGTGCGGCVPMVKDLIQGSMKKMGRIVRNVICEHFDYTRQEIFDLIKIKKIKTYNEALDVIGKGHGCEVCKPAVASILASLWNEPIQKQATIQDSNDRFLANIQKGGTYSVVPRIPGGEITPEKLIVIGQVAQKYGLYTKITGGQRIDMFGAHVGDLPYIWQELIDAGFESGHAYGKALRTVKSCVGSTWCRFGLHDSVTFAIEIENRYKGFRAPHKLKSAVSGCIRECAEANSKDFGIIATEKGWNLFVCGNGGSKPAHAKLLASDIDNQLVIKYIDRFLMFYTKTAEPLTRTSVWLSKLEGGIDYLREVVIHDCLGMAEAWETEMQSLVNTYHCEWKNAIETPEIRKRFNHFVNSDEKDPTVSFDDMRGQKRATEWK
ncbi:MAG: nitrite reductase large subunit [Saprospiraceae bacterium]|nr:nitrite reductase large subunit [Saprospiraceae bacterium]